MSSAHIKCKSTVTVMIIVSLKKKKKKRVKSKRGCKIAHKCKKKRSRYRDLTKEKIATSKAHPSPA